MTLCLKKKSPIQKPWKRRRGEEDVDYNDDTCRRRGRCRHDDYEFADDEKFNDDEDFDEQIDEELNDDDDDDLSLF